MAKYQQGDVLFVKVSKDEWKVNEEKYQQEDGTETKMMKMIPQKDYNSPRQMNSYAEGGNNKNLTVAYGEATGHSHTFNMKDLNPEVNIALFGKRSTSVGTIPEFVNIAGGPAVIKHEEHAPLTISEGHYKVSIVREYDHMAGRARFVVD
jgi:hypothetical protein|tara:strand:- start:213 stop:662 length:450 start_codon:yes stop_codon:yes gene_type:complete